MPPAFSIAVATVMTGCSSHGMRAPITVPCGAPWGLGEKFAFAKTGVRPGTLLGSRVRAGWGQKGPWEVQLEKRIHDDTRRRQRAICGPAAASATTSGAAMSGRDHDTRPYAKRRNAISGQFAARPIEMLESPAYRALSVSAHMVISRIEIELAHRGGNDNGQLPVTVDQFVEDGMHRSSVAPAIREAEALGFIRVERGRGGNADYHRPNKFYLTFSNWRGAEAEPPSHDRKRIKSIDEAEQIAREARAAKDRNAVSFGKFAWRRRNLKTLADQQKWAEKNLRRKREEMAEREKQMVDTAPPYRAPRTKQQTSRPPEQDQR